MEFAFRNFRLSLLEFARMLPQRISGTIFLELPLFTEDRDNPLTRGWCPARGRPGHHWARLQRNSPALRRHRQGRYAQRDCQDARVMNRPEENPEIVYLCACINRLRYD